MDGVIWVTTLLAEAAPAGGGEGTGPAQPGGGMGLIIMMVGLFAVFYFLIIRPQRKKEQERQREREAMLSAIGRNDHVMTIGGIHGVVTQAPESGDYVILRVDEKSDVRIKVSREAISRVVTEEAKEGESPKLGE